MEKDCIFCKIINKEIESEILLEDENAIVIKSIQPVATHHFLIIPKVHTENMLEYEKQPLLLGKILNMCNKIKEKYELDSFRLVSNCGKGAGQSVMHTHFHVLSGKEILFDNQL